MFSSITSELRLRSCLFLVNSTYLGVLLFHNGWLVDSIRRIKIFLTLDNLHLLLLSLLLGRRPQILAFQLISWFLVFSLLWNHKNRMPYNLSLRMVGEVGNLGQEEGCCMGKYNKKMCVTTLCWRTFLSYTVLRQLISIVLFGYTIFYVFNTFSIKRHLVISIFSNINNAIKKSYTLIFSHIYKYIILVKSLEMEFLGQQTNAFCILKVVAKCPPKRLHQFKIPLTKCHLTFLKACFMLLNSLILSEVHITVWFYRKHRIYSRDKLDISSVTKI